MGEINLWKETIRCLEENGKMWEDVKFIQGDDFQVSKDNFEEVAKKTDYSNDYGMQYIAQDLKVIGEDFWLERYEYDGSEWWEFKQKPVIKDIIKEIESIVPTDRYGHNLNGFNFGEKRPEPRVSSLVVVTKDVPPGITVVGNPARPIDN